MHTCINAYMHVCIHLHIHTFVRSPILTFIHTFSRSFIHSLIQSFHSLIDTKLYSYIYTYIYIHTHAYIHTHTLHTSVRRCIDVRLQPIWAIKRYRGWLFIIENYTTWVIGDYELTHSQESHQQWVYWDRIGVLNMACPENRVHTPKIWCFTSFYPWPWLEWPHFHQEFNGGSRLVGMALPPVASASTTGSQRLAHVTRRNPSGTGVWWNHHKWKGSFDIILLIDVQYISSMCHVTINHHYWVRFHPCLMLQSPN